MFVLIDESGCSGFKLGKGSSPFFVVGMVIFDDPGEAERTNVAIQEARTQLRVKPEFKFSKSSDTVRDGFFTAISAYKFSIRAIVIEKAKIYSPHLRTGPDSFYNFFVNMLIQHDGGRTAGSQYQN